MSLVPHELKYTPTHEWTARDEDDLLTVGITDFAQHSLGDVVFVELPEVGTNLVSGQECGVVESVKAASDIYSPLDGEVMAINEELAANPALINIDPYQEGWIFKIRPNDIAQWEDLMDADAYEEKIESI
jgi:glycine cleavage system H protein